jgi:hypothetical protein
LLLHVYHSRRTSLFCRQVQAPTQDVYLRIYSRVDSYAALSSYNRHSGRPTVIGRATGFSDDIEISLLLERGGGSRK